MSDVKIRPTFYYQNDNKKPIRASGILMYCKLLQRHYYLLTRYFYDRHSCDGLWSDLGGKTDAVDKSPMETAAREFMEESNGLLFDDKSEIISLLQNDEVTKEYYVSGSKYLLYMINLDFSYFLKVNDFGMHETHNNYRRDISWLTEDKLKKVLKKRRFHPRLSLFSNILLNRIDELTNLVKQIIL